MNYVITLRNWRSINLSEDEDFALRVDVDAGERWGHDLRGRTLELATREGTSTLGTATPGDRVRFSLKLPPRRITLVHVAL